MSEQLKIRPYARLLTMLGDQLIKNEQIAVTELMKNSYDADADWVKVSFENFGKDYKNTFVFADEGPFKAVETMLIKAKINTWVSLLLVDIEKKKVVKESIIRNETGSNKSDFFQNKCFGNRKGRI